ncbi:ATP-binding protein [Phyllobacterium sp. 21LDTY02-6]|uniref:sensor histidine kinase n=1 Tax=Phyllobacterium sp. 21LDTY02-6 TaxID=2944903 RepID=UPI0020219B48|nr:ATP-binding protein [Phyllobacterium sp. 21LDTY02-6]MCO4318081.1 ATP-binding protein [Phyllobacterium sp. 21LDTY02-6]
MNWRKYITAALYGALLLGAGFCLLSFLRADNYRVQTDEIMSQTFEIQDRASQAREKLANIKGYLIVAVATQQPQPRLLAETMLLSFNLKALAKLDYVDRFLDVPELDVLHRTVAAIETSLLPHIKANDQLKEALESIPTFEADIFRISGATLAHSLTLRATAAIEANAMRNKLLFACALLVLGVAFLLIFQRSLLARRKDEHVRSFASLFAHMTRSRIAALRLFLDYLAEDRLPSPGSVEAARSTIAELDSINEGMMTMGHAKVGSKTTTLGELLVDIEKNCPLELQMEIDEEANAAVVPASQFHLLIDELVGNAVNAVAGSNDPRITIKAELKRRLWRRTQLITTVSDNGVGMTSSFLVRAHEPFFSTKAGVHVGLGLTNCVSLVKTMAGKLKITSAAGLGTTVRITYVLR